MRHKKTMGDEAASKLEDVGGRGLAVCEEALTLIDSWDVIENVYQSDYIRVRSWLKSGMAAFRKISEKNRA